MSVTNFSKTVSLLIASRFIQIKANFFSRSTKLVEIGHLEQPMPAGNYKTGQLFIHKMFGYRGLILCPWLARVHDRDVDKNKHNKDSQQHSPDWDKSPDESRGRIETFYNVLIDERDCPFIRANSEAVTFLANMETSRDLFAVPGLDYVWHQDVLPYTSSSGEDPPLRHELLQQLMKRQMGQDPPYVAQDTLVAWQAKNCPWLQLSEVYKETTEGVQVTVIPFYMGARRGAGRGEEKVHWWRCHISLVNLSQLACLVLERQWRVYSEGGALNTMRGHGVDGLRPLLTHSMPAFQFSSQVGLTNSSGHMWGSFQIQREDGLVFDCRVPPFSLQISPHNNISQLDQ